jgi:hypothetical protein
MACDRVKYSLPVTVADSSRSKRECTLSISALTAKNCCHIEKGIVTSFPICRTPALSIALIPESVFLIALPLLVNGPPVVQIGQSRLTGCAVESVSYGLGGGRRQNRILSDRLRPLFWQHYRNLSFA